MRRESVTLSGRFHFLRDCYTLATPSTRDMGSRMHGNDRPEDLYVLPTKVHIKIAASLFVVVDEAAYPLVAYS